MKKKVDFPAEGSTRLLREAISDLQLTSDMTLHEVVVQLEKMGGFSSVNLTRAINLIVEMIRDQDCTRFLSFTANLVATGLRGALAEMIQHSMIDVIITTGGAIDHDIARSFGGKYYSGTFEAADPFLHAKKIHRLGNVFIPFQNYGQTIEKATFKILDEVTPSKATWAPSDLLREVGSRIKDKNSILAAASKKQIPVIVPGITDSAFGTDLFIYSETHKFQINPLLDMKLASDTVFEAKHTGALILGGGISKHHTLWWNQFKDGLTYAVAITTASEYDGSLSGARLHEAITWGKIKPDAKNITIDGDATILFPIMLAELFTRIKKHRT